MMTRQFTTCLGALALAAAAHGQLRIVATTTDFADLARQIGGDRAEVHSVMKGPENVHNVVARPTEMILLNKADLFVHGGLDAEPWRDTLLKGARNPKVLPGRPGNVDMSAGIELLDVPAGRVDRSMGDIHAYGNPHYQLSPRNAQRMAVTLCNAMCDADRANAGLYKANAKAFVAGMGELEERLREQLAPYAGLKIVTYHPAWGYLAESFGLEVVATIESKPAITPSPGRIREVVEIMRREGVKIVVVETYNSAGQARSVAEAAGAQVLVLPDHVLGLAAAGTYQDLFRYDVGKLVEAAQAAGVAAHGPG